MQIEFRRMAERAKVLAGRARTPRETFQAFRLGKRSISLYRSFNPEWLDLSVEDFRERVLGGAHAPLVFAEALYFFGIVLVGYVGLLVSFLILASPVLLAVYFFGLV